MDLFYKNVDFTWKMSDFEKLVAGSQQTHQIIPSHKNH
jgi:hypothetical protein